MWDDDNDRFTWRKLRVLVKHLPTDSAIARALIGETADWTRTDRLLADLIDAVRIHSHADVAMHGVKEGKPHPWPDPVPVPRPWMTPGGGIELVGTEHRKRGPRRQSSASDIRGFFGGAGTGAAASA